MSEDKVFLDTNIIIYAYDITAGRKHKVAGKIMMDLWDTGLGVLSTQVIQEFFVNISRKIPKPIDEELARAIVADLLKWDVVINDCESILEAIDILLKYGYSFWDSLIIEAAVKGGSRILFSEDFSHGQTIAGVTIKNPFIS
jgi:predicted nucleic acid-binding protein